MSSISPPQNSPTFPYVQEANNITSIQEQFGEQLIYSTLLWSCLRLSKINFLLLYLVWGPH